MVNWEDSALNGICNELNVGRKLTSWNLGQVEGSIPSLPAKFYFISLLLKLISGAVYPEA